MAGVYYLAAPANEHFRWTMATGYAGLGLLAVTLILGPINSLRRVPTPVSFDLRRDLGLWACILSVWHVVLGLQSHLIGETWRYFYYKNKFTYFSGLRHDLFGWANHTGLLATLIVAMLALISNDRSLQVLGAARWKQIQRGNYLLFGLVVLHSALYQILTKRNWPFVVLLALIAAIVALLQLARIRRAERQ